MKPIESVSARHRIDDLTAAVDLRTSDNRRIEFRTQLFQSSPNEVSALLFANDQVISRFSVVYTLFAGLSEAIERAFTLVLETIIRAGGLLTLCNWFDKLVAVTDPRIRRNRVPLNARPYFNEC